MQKTCINSNATGAVVSLSKWLEQVGVTACTAWRWRKRGWLQTVNICGRQYLTQEAIDAFHHRAVSGEFAQVPTVPARKGPHENSISPLLNPALVGEKTE